MISPSSAASVPEQLDTRPLSWVMAEIREALNQSARAMSEALTQSGETQAATLRAARLCVHQAHGALQIVEIDGITAIARSAEEILGKMESGARAPAAAEVDDITAAYQALTEYLEELLAGAPNQPVRLYPYYKALLTLEGADRIHPSELFYPRLTPRSGSSTRLAAVDGALLAGPQDAAGAATETGQAAPFDLAALRQRYEKALLPFLKSTDAATEQANAALMLAVVTEVAAAQEEAGPASFWWVMRGFAELVAGAQLGDEFFGEQGSEKHVKQLFARINMQLRKLAKPPYFIDEAVLRDALFFISLARQPSPLLQQIRSAYGLDGMVPADYERKRYGQVNTLALAQARTHLADAKSGWGRITSGDESAVFGFEHAMHGLAGAGTALNSVPLAKLLRELNSIARHAAHASPDEGLGLEMASSLLFVESALNHTSRLADDFAHRAEALSTRLLALVAGERAPEKVQWLDEMSRAAHERETMSAVAGEIKGNLAQVEKVLDAYFNAPAKAAQLETVDATLQQIEGVLDVLDQGQAAQAVRHTRAAVARFVARAMPAPLEGEAADGEDVDQQATALDAGNDDDLDDEHGSATLVSADEQAQFEQVARNIGALSFFIESLQGNPDGAASRFSFDAASGIFHADLLGPAKAPEHKLAHSDAASVPVPAPSAVDHADTLPPPGAPETALTSMAPPETSAAPAGASTAVAGQGSGIDVQHESTRHAGADQPETAPPTSADAAEQATHAPHRSEEADVATAANTPDVVAGSPHSGEEAVASDASEVPAPIDESALDTMRVPQRPGPPVAPLPVSVVPQSDAAVDAELLDIFLGEAAEVLDFVRQTVPRLEQQPASHEHLTALRRSFHTLKGSGRMVGLMAFGEAAWSMEQVFNLYLSEHRGAGEHLLALLAMADGELGAWIAELRDAGVSQRDGAALKQAARLLLDADTQAHPNAGTCGSTADTAAAAPPASSDSAAQTEQEIRAAPAAELAPVEASEAAESIEETKVVDQAQAVDVVDTAVAAASLEEIQAVEEVQAVDAMEAAHAAESVAEIQGVQEGQFVDVEGRSVDVDEAAKAAKSFEEIKKVDEVEAADTVEAVEAAKAVEETKPVEEIIAVDVVEAIEVPEAIEGPEAIEADEAMQAASVAEVQEAPLATVIGFPGRHTAEVPRDDTIKRIGTLEISVPLHNIYLAETDELVRLLANDLAEWRHEPERRVNTLAVNAAHSLAGSSATVGFTSLQDLAHALELVLHTLVRLPDPLRGFEFDALAAAIECMRRMLTQFALGELAGPELRHVQALQELKARILARAVPLPVEEQEEDEVATAASSLVEDQAANDPELDAEIDLDIDFDLGPTFVIEPVAPVVTVVQEAEPVPDIPEISEASLKALADDLEHGETLVSSASALSGADQEQDSAELTDFDLDLDAEIDLQEASAAAFADTDADADKAGMQPGQQQASGAQDIDDAQPGSGADSSDDSAANRSGNHAAFDAAGNEDGGQAAAAEAEARFEREEFSAAQLGAAAKLIAAATILPVMLAEDLVPPTEVLYEHEHSGAAATSRIPKDELDADLLPVFIEEASDILPEMGRNLRQLMETPGERSSVQSLLRLLHTIKGSSRMAGAMVLGQHLHEMESRIEQVTLQGAPSQAAVEELLARFDVALSLFDRLQNPLAADAMPAAPGQNPASAAPAPASDPAPAVPASDPAPTVPASVPAPAVPEPAATGKRAKAAQARKAAKGAAKAADAAADVVPVAAGAAPLPSQAIVPAVVTAPAPALPVSLVRVRADILDRLVNQAGEVSISRSRVETDVALLKSSLSELSDNVARLQGQLREIEIQAESQMASQMQQANDREFDPLEFDRFTRLQELTRIMAESVNDVASVQQNLSRTVDDASNNLGQQARITRDLQQDLMRVRMVQFGSISERLYRITRQASKELDKRVNLDIRGGAVEIDRSVLEKMTGPFEHLLRNSIVHGIESRAERTAAGKNETGELLVEVRQAGNEVVIHVSDDGRGLDLDRIAEKARATGLLSADSEPSEAEVRDMIFHPGFSTAREITELAGRGIGMDVVRAEAVSLGGRISIESSAGKGAQFTIHLPLTLAVTQVVVLATGGKTYAVPSVLVEQVQQLKSTALVAAYNEGAVLWMGQRVPMFYLSALLGDHVTAPLTQQYTPVLILKSGTQRVAVHVDAVLGNREVVIKNIGPQLSRMIGVAGATVLGAGDIVLILDPVPLAQRHASDPSRGMRPQTSEHSQVQLANAVDIADAAYPHLEQAGSLELGAVAELNEILLPAPQTARAPLQTVDTAPAAARPALPPSVSAPAGVSTPVQGLRTQRTVMVVDDSLTVRRVTQRMLAREGYQVVLAKDGVDALEQLQAIRPDVMLVDIEMPRMDGFDLTRNVRSDERTRAIPIIMITSRTAVKHRTYAMELGVNEYLGKPYQEEQLLKLVAGFVRSEVPAA